MIILDSVKKFAGERTILDIDRLEIEKGERIALLGANGSGKSTLLKIISSVIQPDEGYVKIEDMEGPIFYMPQQSYGFSFSVYKNILLALDSNYKKEEKSRLALEAMEEFGLGALKDKRADRLSGGETQRMALARLMVCPRKVLLLDEPTSAMDIEGEKSVEKIIFDYCEKNKTTLVMATHSPRQALYLADRLLLMHEGRIVEDTSPKELVDSPKSHWGKVFIEHQKF
ncbi:MAG TPA: ABC transporter ATP-binding protein [Clostridiales bacterium]|nr:ABC transporter ATP-binding protein [Clostridiales bacterium]